MGRPDRYLPIPEPEHMDDLDAASSDLGPDDGYYCMDCTSWPFISVEDLEEHDRWHIEQAARLDPYQGNLLAGSG